MTTCTCTCRRPNNSTSSWRPRSAANWRRFATPRVAATAIMRGHLQTAWPMVVRLSQANRSAPENRKMDTLAIERDDPEQLTGQLRLADVLDKSTSAKHRSNLLAELLRQQQELATPKSRDAALTAVEA